MTLSPPGCNATPREFLHWLPLLPDYVIRLHHSEIQNRGNPERKKSVPHAPALHAERCQIAHAIVGEDEIDYYDVPTGFQDPRCFAHYALSILTILQFMDDEIRGDDIEAGVWKWKFAGIGMLHFNSVVYAFESGILQNRILFLSWLSGKWRRSVPG
jgi:hypothetical protein